MKKFSFLMTLLLALVLMLAACSGDSSEEPEEDPGEETEQENNEGSEEEDEEASEGEGEDQVLVFARGGDSESLDFASTTDGESSRVTKQIYESLLDFDKESFDIVPGLAHDWDVNDEGTEYTFYLEEGVKFHDGTDFNADAVKTNFERWADPEHEFAFADADYVYAMYGIMFGGKKGDESHVIEDIEVVDDHTVTFHLKRPLGYFLQNMAMSYFAITSPAALEEHGAEINENPVGTGPFKFVSWDRDQSIVLEKNEEYWKEGLPKLDRVIFEVIPENSSRLMALRSGDIDIMDGLNPDDAAGVESDPEIDLYTRAANNFGYLGMNVEKAPLDDKLVRQAINYAVDREAIAEALYAGYATPGVNPLPPGYLGYNDELEGYEYDPDKAMELLEEAGYGDGVEIELWTMPVARPYMPDPETVADIIRNNLEQVGITAEIVREEWAPYLQKTADGEQQLFMLGWSGTNGDPDYFLGSLLHSDGIGGSNYTRFSNEEVDELIDQAKVETDQDTRAELYKEAQAIIHEEAPMVVLVHSEPVLAASSRVQNYVPHPSTSESLAEVELSE
ncbi:ABC transporter substrate-binding protein [Piscibacillus sp. B03]|uniref:ABC transporter substrate-binding protein n=1 Tax=Piscibacillus sp. B03 TaxID=3457430 RepID=UPI003FCCDFEB